jgi:hypothetical protein
MSLRALNSLAVVGSTYFLLLISASVVLSNWVYMGFYLAFDSFNFIVALLSIFCLGIHRYSILHRYQFYSDLILAFWLIPALVLYTLSVVSFELILLYFIIYLIFCFVIAVQLRKFKGIVILDKHYLAMLSCIVILVGVYVSFDFGFQNVNFNLLAAYDFRESAQANLSVASRYLYSGLAKVLLPLAIILSLATRNFLLLIVLIVIAIMLAAVSSHKSIIFLCALSVLTFFLTKIERIRISIPVFVICSIAILGLLDEIYIKHMYGSDIPFLGSLIQRRGLFSTPLNDQFYISFFKENPYVFWSDSKISLGLIDYPFSRSLPFEVGYHKRGIEGYSANTGILGSGYANAGVIGATLYALIFSFISKLVIVSNITLPAKVLESSYLVIFLTILLSSDLVTAIISHGLIFFIFTFFVKYKAREKA